MSSSLLEDASFNQSPAFGDVDLFSADRPLADAAKRAGLFCVAVPNAATRELALDAIERIETFEQTALPSMRETPAPGVVQVLL